MTVIPFPRSPLADDETNELTGTLVIVDDYFDKLLEQMMDKPFLTSRQVEIIDTINTKIMAFQLKASVLITQDGNRHENKRD